jgi:hypothetical protein
MFEAVPQGERRYIDEQGTNPAFQHIEQGTSLKAQSGPLANRFNSLIEVEENKKGAVLKVPKTEFLSQPLERRRQYSPEEIAEIEASESVRNHHIFEMSRRMCRERAETVIRAVFIALHEGDDVVIENPFRRNDSLKEAVAVVRAADLKGDLTLPHIPHKSKDCEPGHGTYRQNVRLAVGRLMGFKEEQKPQE